MIFSIMPTERGNLRARRTAPRNRGVAADLSGSRCHRHDGQVPAWQRAGSHVAEPELLPALAHARLVLRRRPHRRREALAAPLGAALELPVARGVEEHAVPEAGAELRDVAVLERRGRIDRRAEASGEDDDAALARVDPMRHRPVDLLVRRHVDVVLDHPHVLVAVLRGGVAPERGGDLLGLTLIMLGDLYADVHAVGDRMDVDVADAGNARAGEDVPGDGRALHGGHHAVLAVRARQRALEAALEDRLAPVRDARDLLRLTRLRHVGDVAGELPEGPL